MKRYLLINVLTVVFKIVPKKWDVPKKCLLAVQDSSRSDIVCPLGPTNNQSLGSKSDYNDYIDYNDYYDYNDNNDLQ